MWSKMHLDPAGLRDLNGTDAICKEPWIKIPPDICRNLIINYKNHLTSVVLKRVLLQSIKSFQLESSNKYFPSINANKFLSSL